MATRPRADIIVGIDFGMTCTGYYDRKRQKCPLADLSPGVAYTYGPEWPDPKVIQRWPGKLGHELRNKVDTAISYDLRSGAPVSWGFLCDPDDDSVEYNALFKLYLDENHKDTLPDPPSTEDARRWFRDYLGCLYRAIIKVFSDTFPQFGSRSIE